MEPFPHSVMRDQDVEPSDLRCTPELPAYVSWADVPTEAPKPLELHVRRILPMWLTQAVGNPILRLVTKK